MGLSAIWKKLHGNRPVIARGEAECNLGRPIVSAIFNSSPCGYLLVIRHLANNN